MHDDRKEVRILAALAGISVPPQREVALATGLAGTKRIAEALAKIDLGPAEPAAHFVPPTVSR